MTSLTFLTTMRKKSKSKTKEKECYIKAIKVIKAVRVKLIRKGHSLYRLNWIDIKNKLKLKTAWYPKTYLLKRYLKQMDKA